MNEYLIGATVKIDTPDATQPEIQKLIALAEQNYCPVWAMIKGNTEVMVNVEIGNRIY